MEVNMEHHQDEPGPVRVSGSAGAMQSDGPPAGPPIAASIDPLIEALTRRETEVLDLVCDGRSNAQIAQRLDIGLATVKYHVNQIFGKLGVVRRTQAVAIAVHLRLVAPPWLPPARTRPPAGNTGSIP
jgi:DNA-binding CsgD family transcriptional regulator